MLRSWPSLSLPVQFSSVLFFMSIWLPYTQDLGHVALKGSLFLPLQFSVGLAFHVAIVALHTGPGMHAMASLSLRVQFSLVWLSVSL